MSNWNWLILALSIYAILELLAELIIPYTPETLTNVNRIDIFISVFFLIDFFWLYSKAENKKRYFQKNWIDLLASIPFAGVLRGFKLFKIAKLFKALKIFKVVRSFKAIKNISNFYKKDKPNGTLILYSFGLLLVIIYCSIGFYNFENPVNDQVNCFEDSLWWAFITVTSVGYGDVYPITSNGKIIAVILTLGGMGLFSVLTADILSFFLKPKAE